MIDIKLLEEELETVANDLDDIHRAMSADVVRDAAAVLRSYRRSKSSVDVVDRLRSLEHPGMTADQVIILNEVMFHIADQDRIIERLNREDEGN